MTVDEWKMIVDEIESLWGRSAKWAKADSAYRYAKPIPYQAARSGMNHLFMQGGYTPAPADVIHAARGFMDAPMTADEITMFCDRHGHAYGIVDETNGIRTGVCGRCRHETEKAAHLMPVLSELEDGTFTGRPDADHIERIAP